MGQASARCVLDCLLVFGSERLFSALDTGRRIVTLRAFHSSMKLALLALIPGLVVPAFAQEATPPPKKDPFPGFGKTTLDGKTPAKLSPGLPQKPAVPMTPPPFVPPPSSGPAPTKQA